MGGGGRGEQKRGRTQRRHFRQPRENVWKRSKSDSPSDNPTWEPFATQNLAFEEYYKEQGIVSEEEWDVFMDVLRKPLPAAFRINSSGQFFGDIRSQLENDFMKSLKSETTDEGEVEAIRPLPWYPDNLAWHLNFSRMQLRKNQTLERFHQFLKQENEIGNITRQEAVSMVPPLFLDISPDHFVLDMCAAPGSKTFQLLEIIHQSSKRGSLPIGMIIANDADVQRCNLLIHQMKRMCTANLIVTNHEAQHFPGCRLSNDFYDANEKGSVQEYGLRQLLFDRVLCDVPCSGDGTLRKAPDIWRKWNAGMGNGFHSLQVQIAMRGLSLLKVGGRMVYSTCSMNPVENEAVVAEILRRCGQSIELVDASGELPQLVRRPGHKKWKVRDKGIWFASYDDVPEYRRSVIFPSMFPSGKSCETEKAMSDYFKENTAGGNGMEILPDMPERQGNVEQLDAEHRSGQFEKPETLDNALEKEVSGFPLERCMRILPHDQNSGAFFIAVLCKLLPLPAVAGYPINSHGRSTFHKDVPLQKVSDEIIEDTNGLEINPSGDDGVNHEHTEEAFDIDLQNKESEAVFNPDSCGKCEEVKEQEAQVHGDGENGPKKGRGGKQSLQIQGRWRGVDPVVFFADSTSISSIKAFYGIDEYFPFDGNLVSRNSDCHHVKRIYYISNSVKDVLKRNFQVGQQLKITSIGLKMFERQTSKEGTASPCMFRISSEGLPLLLPYITKQILYASLPDFKHLLQYKTIKFADFVDPEFGDKASKLLLGCCVVVLKKGSCSPLSFITTDSSTLAIGGWRGRTNITAMVSAMDCQELLERLSVCLGSQSNSLVRENKSVSADSDTAQNSDDIELKHNLEALKEAPPV